MLNKRDLILSLLILSVFIALVGVYSYYEAKDAEEKELIKPFKILKGDGTYELKCLDGYEYILYKERNNVSISQMMIDGGSRSDRARLRHCKED